MPAAKASKPPIEAGPDDLARETAGSYVSGDKRFEVRQSDGNWYVVDREQANEFGQELIHGPFGSMKSAKEQMPGLRAVKPLPRTMARPKRAPEKKPPKPQPNWTDKLPANEATDVRKQIRALERDGVDDADAIVRRDRQGLQPAIATTLLERRLSALTADLTADDQKTANKVIDQLDELLADGDRNSAGLTGWALVEIGADRKPTGRKLRLRG
jgi:hypothetical protein